MKKILYLLLVAFFTVSCSKDDVKINDVKYCLELQSTMSSNTLQDIMDKIGSLPLSRNEDSFVNDVYIDSCKQILKPLIDDGRFIQRDIIAQSDSLKILGVDIEIDEDIEYVRNLSEDELATLSFIVYNVNTVDIQLLEPIKNAELIEETPFSNPVQYETGSQARLVSCLSAAVGLTALKELGIGGVVTATSVRKALLAIGKRYLGYVGVAIMIYDFTMCMGE